MAPRAEVVLEEEDGEVGGGRGRVELVDQPGGEVDVCGERGEVEAAACGLFLVGGCWGDGCAEERLTMEEEQHRLRVLGADPEGFGAVRKHFPGRGDLVLLRPLVVDRVRVLGDGPGWPHVVSDV